MNRFGKGQVPLAQLYFRQTSRRLSAEQLEELFQKTRDEAISRTREIYAPRLQTSQRADGQGPSIAADVRVEEGSFKVIVTVLGIGFGFTTAASQVYDMVVKWQQFKAGVKEMCEDARRFDIEICESIWKLVGGTKEKTTILKRTAVPGSLRRLIQKIEALEADAPDLKPEETRRKLIEIKRDLLRLNKQLTPEDSAALNDLLTRRTPFNDGQQSYIPTMPIAALRPEGTRVLTTYGTVTDFGYLPAPKRVKPNKQAKFERQERTVVLSPYNVQYTYGAQKREPPAIGLIEVRRRPTKLE